MTTADQIIRYVAKLRCPRHGLQGRRGHGSRPVPREPRDGRAPDGGLAMNAMSADRDIIILVSAGDYCVSMGALWLASLATWDEAIAFARLTDGAAAHPTDEIAAGMAVPDPIEDLEQV